MDLLIIVNLVNIENNIILCNRIKYKSMRIYVIRHGETDANKNGMLQGRIDEPLNDYGVKLAKITGENMKGIKFDVCFSSPLNRALNTAKIVLEESDNKDCEIITDERLIEINMGEYEGKRFRPGENEVPAYKLLLFKWNAFLVGRFPKGETAREVCQRTQNFLKELCQKDYENVLVSMHGCSLRGMLNCLYKNKFNYWQTGVPLNCAVSIIDVIDGVPKLIESDKIYYDESLKIDRYKVEK